jgi:hypothetical protein
LRVTTRSNPVGAAECAGFLIATGLIAIHVVGDNLLQPEPGTSAADHLVSGLVPLACLLGAALAYIAASRWFIVPLVSFATLSTAVFSNGLPPPDLADIIRRIAPRPVLLIYTENGVGGEELNQVFHKAAGGIAKLWRVPGSSHLGGMDAQPEEYERRVTDFFDRALLTAPR